MAGQVSARKLGGLSAKDDDKPLLVVVAGMMAGSPWGRRRFARKTAISAPREASSGVMAKTGDTAGAVTAAPTAGATAGAVGATCEVDVPAAATAAEGGVVLSALVVPIILSIMVA